MCVHYSFIIQFKYKYIQVGSRLSLYVVLWRIQKTGRVCLCETFRRRVTATSFQCVKEE